MSSLSIPEPSVEKSSSSESDIIYSWSGVTKYLVNETTEMVYLGVKGFASSLYYLSYTVDTGVDIPAKYIKLADGTQNNFVLDSDN